MRVIIQRVQSASVTIQQKVTASIGEGFMILLGIETNDSEKDVEWLTKKIIGLRIFSDDEGKMNKSVIDINGEILVVSQFTLHAGYKKGNRPSFIKAAAPEKAIPLYQSFVKNLEVLLGKTYCHRHLWCRYESGTH
jgi:D-tyrosyl-tRNA(Tyr) deacylase